MSWFNNHFTRNRSVSVFTVQSNRQGAPDEPEPAALDLRAAHASLQ